MSEFRPAEDMDEVLAQLAAILDEAQAAGSRLGYFAALYRKVTERVKEGIASGRFQDGPLMARLDVVFANRYLEALDAWQQGRPCCGPWRLAFETCARWRPLILQQLLLGINAHINYDLGIAAATVAPGPALAGLQADFDEINAVLAELTGGVQAEIDALSPWIGLLDKVGGRTDAELVKFSLDEARKAAWGLAEELAGRPAADWAPRLARLDAEITDLGRLVRWPGFLLGLVLLLVRGAEVGNPRRIIRALR